VIQFLPILAMILLVILFVAVSFTASLLLTTKRPTRAKTAPYECGIVPEEEPVERFPVRFYLVAMAFIVLDVWYFTRAPRVRPIDALPLAPRLPERPRG
jgi:NADH-quinone oxidoreductase subunit A